MRALKQFVIAMLVMVALLSIFLYWGSHNQTISQWLVNRTLAAVSQKHQLDEFHGTLADGFSISELKLTLDNDDRIEIKDLVTQWQFSLLTKSLYLQKANVNQIDYIQANKTSEATSNNDKPTEFEFSSPIKIFVDNLKVNKLAIQNEHRTIDIDAIAARFELDKSDLELHTLSLQHGASAFSSSGLARLQAPYTVDVKSLLANATHKFDAILTVNGEITGYEIDGTLESKTGVLPEGKLKLRATSDRSSLSSFELSINSEAGTAQITGDADWKNTLKAELTIEGSNINTAWPNTDLGASLDASGKVNVTGDTHDIYLELDGKHNRQPIELILQANGDLNQSRISDSRLTLQQNDIHIDGVVDWVHELTAALNISSTNLHPQVINSNLDGSLDLTGTVELAGSEHRSNIELEGKVNDHPLSIMLGVAGDKEVLETISATLTSDESTVHINGLANLATPFSSNMDVKVTALDPSLINSDLAGKIQGDGNVKIEGKLLTAQFNLTGLLQNLPLTLNLDLASDDGNITISDATLTSQSGSLVATGNANFSDGANASIKLHGTNFDPQVFYPKYPGELNLMADVDLVNDRFETSIEVDGTLRNHPLRATIDASGTSTELFIQPSSIVSGGNTLYLEGNVNGEGIQALEWNINAPQLASLSPDLKGLLTGHGSLNGNWDSLQGDSIITGSGLRYKNYTIDTLGVKFLPNEKNQQALKLTASGIELERFSFDKLTIDAIGTSEQQVATIALSNDPGDNLSTNLIISKINAGYEIDISDTIFNGKSWPTLKQARPVLASLVNQNIELKDFCLEGEAESICLQASNKEQQFKSHLTLQNLPLTRLSRWYGGASELEETLSGNFVISRKNSYWMMDSNFSIPDDGDFDAKISFDATTENIDGDIKGRFPSAHWLGMFTEELLEPQGVLNIDLNLDGTLQQPQFVGAIDVVDASTIIPSLGIRLDQLGLEMKANNTGKVTLTGRANSGDGSLTLAGNLYFNPLSDWRMELDVAGKEALLANLSEYRIIASPTLQVKTNPETINVEGKIEINQAKITLAELPVKAITVSEDTHVINNNANTQKQLRDRPLSANLALILGDDVRLSGLGFEGKLDGTLKISDNSRSATSATGTVHITEGTYSVYGQELTLKDGTLHFNGPVSEPGVSLRAERQIKKQTVGLEVGGTLKYLKSEVYSDPVLSQSDSISYLITGKPVRSAGQAESGSVLNALTSMGVNGSAAIIDDIRTSTGLTKLELEGGDDIEETALLIGKYLSPQLYVEYIKRLFGDEDSLQLHYEFNDKIHLEAETGTQQGIDLIYQVER